MSSPDKPTYQESPNADSGAVITIWHVASNDGYQQLWGVECSQHGTVNLYGDPDEAREAKRQHSASHNGSSGAV
jgi:hypothetical protein